MQHLAGYKLAGGCIDDLTCNQELFVALVAEEELRLKARLAGAKVPPARRHTASTGKQDHYGELLEQQKRMLEQGKNEEEHIEKCGKPL